MSAKDKKKGKAEKITLEVVERNRTREMEFNSEEEMIGWQRAYRKSKWYTPYFLVGIGINFLLYRSGVDLAKNIMWGFIIGVGVPVLTMLVFTEIHYRLFIAKTIKQ